MDKFTRTLRSGMIEELSKKLSSASTIVVTNFGNLNAVKQHELRTRLKNADSDYIVVKNTTARQSMAKLKMDEIAKFVEGQCGLAITDKDSIGLSKALAGFSKENTEFFNIRAALVDGRIVSADEIKELAALPSRDVLLSMLLAVMQSPVSGFVLTLRTLVGQIVQILKNKAENTTHGSA